MFRKKIFSLAAIAAAFYMPASGMSLKEFGKFSAADQGLYVAAAASILAYSHAANGDVPRAKCIRQWFFGGGNNPEAPGVRDIMRGIGPGSNLDPEKHHIEGVILGAVDKACPLAASGFKR